MHFSSLLLILQYTDGVIKELKYLWPNCSLVRGNPRRSTTNKFTVALVIKYLTCCCMDRILVSMISLCFSFNL